jgi:flagellar motor switch protein FliM
MAEEILSQDEVDALLKGVLGEAEEEGPQADDSAVRTYDIGKQERIVRGRMPTLEIINERFARMFRIGLFNFMQRSAEISVSPVKVVKYSEFVRNLVVPTNLNLVRFKPLRGTALLIFDPNLVFLIVDNLFGGDGRFHMRVEGRDFTPTEQRVIQRLLDVVLSEYKKSWDPVYPIDFEFVRSEMNPQFANIATPSEVVVVTTFNIELGDGGGDFHVCTPYAMIEPIRDILTSSMQGERLEVDDRWLRLMAQQVQIAEVDLVADLGGSSLTLREVMEMKVGDILPLQIPNTITAEIGGVPVLECQYGERNGQYAVKVKRFINTAEG